jgi:hypothetical protein
MHARLVAMTCMPPVAIGWPRCDWLEGASGSQVEHRPPFNSAYRTAIHHFVMPAYEKCDSAQFLV